MVQITNEFFELPTIKLAVSSASPKLEYPNQFGNFRKIKTIYDNIKM